MSLKLSDHRLTLAVILFGAFVGVAVGNEAAAAASSARALDLSWRPLSHSPFHQQFYQNNPPVSLISYSNFNGAEKDEIVEAAKHNAQILKKIKEVAHQPITSYLDPYQLYPQTPGPQAKFVSTTAFLNPNLVKQQQAAAAQASSHVLARMPFPGKAATLYQTKLNYLGKPDGSPIYNQNSIHHSLSSTAKVAGFTKEQGRLNLHFHHPSFATTTKRIPMFSSSVTPHPHPVMNKFQAHMALAQQHHKMKQNIAFSPPSQIMSNYASFGPATTNPFWLAGGTRHNNAAYQLAHDTRDHHNHHQHHHHQHKLPEPQQQVLPSVHPSIITPFLEQVHLKQKEAAAAEQKNSMKQSSETNSQEHKDSYEVVNDVFSKHLVPPPPSSPSHTNFKSKPSKSHDKNEKHKFNLSMKSPLQDASRFNYNNVVSTATPATPAENVRFKPSASDNNFYSTDKPNVFVHLNNRTKDNVYKQHKLLHPAYTGGLKKKPFLPTPYKPDIEESLKNDYEPQHTFFTIEDAVTPHIPAYQIIRGNQVVHHIPVEEEPEVVTLPPRKSIYDYSATPSPTHRTTTTTTTSEAPLELSSPKPRLKLRRRKPRPQQQKLSTQNFDFSSPSTAETTESTIRQKHLRGSIRNSDSQSDYTTELKTRNRVNHPSRLRTRPGLTSPAATFQPAETTIGTSTEEERRNELTSAPQITTEPPTSVQETSEAQDPVKRRVRLRYKNKLRTNALESNDFKQKISDNQIADSENENFVVKQHSDETTEASSATDSGLNEIKSSLKLPNLKLRNERLTTLPTTADTVSTSVQPSSTANVPEQEETNVQNKVANRPRFSIKEIKRKQLFSSSSAITTTPAPTTSPSPASSTRFNRLRLNFNRRRNETNDSGEEVEVTRKRFSTTRTTTTTTTEPTTVVQTTPKRLPKRTFPPRNFTKPSPSFNFNDGETTTQSVKPVRNSTSISSNRPNLRSRINQSHKRKESSNEVVADASTDQIKNINFSSETVVTQEQPSTTSTEAPPYKHETSIMKIAKTPSSLSVEKSSTSTSDFTDASMNDFDLTGSPSEHSQRVAELTISGSDNHLKSANIGPLSRRIPNYFTISTDDPILPIQAFFPQIKTNENN